MRRPKSAVLLPSDDDVETPSKKACKGEPSSRAKVTGRGKARDSKVKCAVDFCEDYRVNGKSCCKLHVRTYDSFRYQANAAAENGDHEMMEAWECMLADEARLVAELIHLHVKTFQMPSTSGNNCSQMLVSRNAICAAKSRHQSRSANP